MLIMCKLLVWHNYFPCSSNMLKLYQVNFNRIKKILASQIVEASTLFNNPTTPRVNSGAAKEGRLPLFSECSFRFVMRWEIGVENCHETVLRILRYIKLSIKLLRSHIIKLSTILKSIFDTVRWFIFTFFSKFLHNVGNAVSEAQNSRGACIP